MVNPLVKKTIQEKVEWIRTLLGKRCLFCESSLSGSEDEEVWENQFPPLPICEICYDKYDFIGRLKEKINESGESTKTKGLIEAVSQFFANKCFFCEKDYKPSKEEQKSITIFVLCQSSCSQRYKMITKWEKTLK